MLQPPGRTFDRPFPKWIHVVAVALAIAGAIAVRVNRRSFEHLLGASVATKITLFAGGSAIIVWKLTELVVLSWASRRWGRCEVAGRQLRFRTPFTQKAREDIVVGFETITDRAPTPHGVRIFVANGGITRAFEALLIPCAPGAETDEVLRLLDTPWATEQGPAS